MNSPVILSAYKETEIRLRQLMEYRELLRAEYATADHTNSTAVQRTELLLAIVELDAALHRLKESLRNLFTLLNLLP